MRHLLPVETTRFVNLDDATTREAAEADPDGFTDQFPEGTLAIDEIQLVPKLLLSIKGALERNRRPGRFAITGSSDLLVVKGSQESLAGRAATIRLHGYSQGERVAIKEDFAQKAWNKDFSATKPSDLSRLDYLELMTQPSFPEIANDKSRRTEVWVDNYVDRVLSKDVTTIIDIAHAGRLTQLLKAIAGAPSSEFVAARLARDLNIPERTLPRYLNALTGTFIVTSVPAWGHNLSKRAISKPKVFVSDPGLCANLTGTDAQGLMTNISDQFTGGLAESFVTAELFKQQGWSEISYRIFHWRDRNGAEVDLVLESRNRQVVGIEVKATMTVRNEHFKGLRALQELAGERFVNGFLFYTGTEPLRFGPNLWALPMSYLWS